MTVPPIQGYCDERFQSVADTLSGHFERGEDVGASVCVIWRDSIVVDLWGGYADSVTGSEWQRDTLVNVWSTTKTMTFLAILVLIERQEIDPNQTVGFYWPEFNAAGKDDITVGHVLSHSAGLAGFDGPMEISELGDWDSCTKRLAQQTPWWSSRTSPGYHAITQGYILGEVVRRVCTSSFGTFFQRELAEPLGADFFVGLPANEEPRVSLVTSEKFSLTEGVSPESICARALSSPPFDPLVPRHRWWREAEIPAANGHGNARSVALLQSILAQGGEARGHRFFSPETAEKVFQVRASGLDHVLRTDLNFGLGYGLSSSAIPVGPRTAFWGGAGGSLVMLDRDLELVVAYAMNHMRAGLIGDQRGPALAGAAMMAALAP